MRFSANKPNIFNVLFKKKGNWNIPNFRNRFIPVTFYTVISNFVSETTLLHSLYAR